MGGDSDFFKLFICFIKCDPSNLSLNITLNNFKNILSLMEFKWIRLCLVGAFSSSMIFTNHRNKLRI